MGHEAKQPRATKAALALLAISLLALILAPTALAAPSHVRREALDVTGLNHACGAATDSKGDLYLASAGESKVKVYDPSHKLLTSIEDINTPCGLAVTTTGVLYVSEKATGEVVQFKPDKYPFEATPTYGSRQVVDASTKAKGIAVDRFDDALYVAKGDRVSAYVHELQTVFLREVVTGGTFILKFEGQETAPIKWDASAKEVQEALEALSTIGAGNVEVALSPGSLPSYTSSYAVFFTGKFAYKDVPLMGFSSSLTGSEKAKILIGETSNGFSGQIGEGLLSEASGVASYSAYPGTFSQEIEPQSDRYLAVADGKGIGADSLVLFGGSSAKALKLHRELTGAATPDGTFGFGAAGAYLATDPGTVKVKKCATEGMEGKEACTAGHLFLYDAAHKALDEFDATGEYLSQTASPAFADAEPTALAIDRSGGANDGTLYVTAGSGAGATALAFRPLQQPTRETLSEPLSHVLASAGAVATDSFGDVYVTAGASTHVYDPKGKEVTSFEDASPPEDLALDSKCNVYVLEAGKRVTYYEPSACPPATGTTYKRHEPLVIANSNPEWPAGQRSLRGIAVNPGPSAGKDHLFVTATGLTREYDSAANGSTPLNLEFAPGVGGTRESLGVYGPNGNVYVGGNPHLIYVVDATGKEVLARIDTTTSASGKAPSNPHLAVDQANGHVIEFDGKAKSAREYEAVADGFVAEFGNFTEGLVIPFRAAVDSSCALHVPKLDETTTPKCKDFDPANGNVYIAFEDTNPDATRFKGVTAFGPLKYGTVPPAEKRKLEVLRAGTGTGKVTSPENDRLGEPVDCGSACSPELEVGTEVPLEAKADPKSEFKGWSGGGCSGTGVCTVTMSEAKKVTAEFKAEGTVEPLEVEIEGTGTGEVISTPGGIACEPTCLAEFAQGSTVELTATSDPGSKFLGWEVEGEPLACPGTGVCKVTMSEAKKVKALFGPETPLLTVVLKGSGTGKVTSVPAGIDCEPTCEAEFELNEEVELEAEADPGSVFVKWGGACSGTEPSCKVQMSEAKEATATFGALPEAIANTAHPVLYSEATLRGEVDPAGLATKYSFEYLTEAEYEAGGEIFAKAKSTPTKELGPSEGLISVQAPLGELAEGTEYRFRLQAHNEVGSAQDEGSFATLQRRGPESCPNAEYRFGLSANLPDCRAYELVTPAQTNGLAPYAAGDGGTPSGSFSNWFTPQRGAGAGERLSYFTDGTLPRFDGNGVLDGYRAQRGAGDHPAEGWQSALFSPDFVQGGIIQHGVAADQRYSIWESLGGTKSPLGALPAGVYLRTPEGFEVLGRGSLGEDLKALSRYLSAGGAHAIFASKEHLEEAAAPEGTEAIYDRAAGAASAEVVSVKPDGSAFGGGEDAKYVGASEDGAAVAFRVGGTLYLHREGKTTEVATALNSFAGISEDGTQVFYAATAEGSSSPLPPAHLYACDTEAGPCAGSGAHLPTEIAAAGIFALVSPDGSHAFFSSKEAIGEEENENGEKPEAGAHNLYAWDGSATRFLGRLVTTDFEDTAFGGIPHMNLGAWTAAIRGIDALSGRAIAPTRSTPGGGAFVFQSHARLTAYDNEGVGEIYRYDPAAAAGERLVCVSCDPSGAPPSADALLADLRNTVIQPKTMIANLADDGNEVFFQSFDRLLPEDANEVEDVYEWRAKGTEGPGGNLCQRPGGCLALISSGQGEVPSTLYAMSADGRDVFFRTQEKLVGADIPGSPSLYDARESGGIPETSEAAPCQGDACQGQGTLPPVLPSPASTGGSEGGEAPKAQPCRKPKHRVKGRCVVRHAKKHHKRRVKHNRRAHR